MCAWYYFHRLFSQIFLFFSLFFSFFFLFFFLFFFFFFFFFVSERYLCHKNINCSINPAHYSGNTATARSAHDWSHAVGGRRRGAPGGGEKESAWRTVRARIDASTLRCSRATCKLLRKWRQFSLGVLTANLVSSLHERDKAHFSPDSVVL